MAFPEREALPQYERLVDKNFNIDPRADLWARMREGGIEEGYPARKDRLFMTPSQIIEWVADGMPHERVWIPKASHMLTQHPNHLDGLRRGISGDGMFRKSLLPQGYPVDTKGVPIHPYYDVLLEKGAVVGPGWYWPPLGPSPSASAIIPVVYEGYLHIPVVTKKGQLLLPGGMVGSIEKPSETAIREAREETDFGMSEDGLDIFTLTPRILPSGRTTLNAWEETQSGVYVPKGLTLDIESHPLRPGDDIRDAGGDAFWMRLSSETLNKLWFGHANDVKEAILAYEKRYKKIITSEGKVHSLIK